MPAARPSSKKLFPVFRDQPSTLSASFLDACAALSLSSTSKPLLHAKENVEVSRQPSSGAHPAKKPKLASFKDLGVAALPPKRRIVLRDVSQEYDVDGEEPEGFKVTILAPETASTKLKIFMDHPDQEDLTSPPPSYPDTTSSKPLPSSRKTFAVYASPPRKTSSLPPPPIKARKAGLGGGSKGLRG